MADTLVSQRGGSWKLVSSDAASPWHDGGAQTALNKAPASGDSVTITAGHTVTFDDDQSGFAAGLAALVINGTLTASTTAGSYYLKMKGHITGTGIFQAGTNPSTGARYPSNCLFNFYVNGTYQINCGASAPRMTCDFWCYDPVVTRSWIVPAAGSRTRAVITGITQANPCVITAIVAGEPGDAHGFQVGDEVAIVGGDMDEITITPFIVKTVPSPTTLTLRWLNLDLAVDSRTFTAYTTGGFLCTKYALVSGTQVTTYDDLNGNAEWERAGALAAVLTPVQTYTYTKCTISAVDTNTVTLGQTLTNIRSGGVIVLTTRNVNLVFAHAASNGTAVQSANGNFDCACMFLPSASYTGYAYGNVVLFQQGSAGVTYFAAHGLFPGGASYTRNGNVVSAGTFVGISGVFGYVSNVTFTGACFGIATAIVSGQACGDYSGLFYNCGQYAGAWASSGCYVHDAEFIGGYMPQTGNVNSTFKNCLFKYSTQASAAGRYFDCYFQNSVKTGEYYGCRFFGIAALFATDYQNGAIPADFTLSRCLIGDTYASNSSIALNVPADQLMHGYSIMNYNYHDGSAVLNNYHQGWSMGGYLITRNNSVTPLLSQASKPAAVTVAHEINCVAKVYTPPTAAAAPAFFDFPLTGQAGVAMNLTCWIVKDTNSMTETPRIQLVDQSYNMMDASHIVKETVMTDNTDWQQITLTHTPTVDGPLYFRVRATNAGGKVQFTLPNFSDSSTTVIVVD